MELLGTWWMWGGFAAIVILLLLVDLLFVGGGKQHKVSLTTRSSRGWLCHQCQP